MNKKAQSEMVGFGIIVIIIAVLILIFLSFSLKENPNDFTESSKTNSFIQASLQFTTTCEKNGNRLSYLDLIQFCVQKNLCEDGQNSCEVLNLTSANLMNSAWRIGEDYPVKGYDYWLKYGGNELVNLSEGNRTGNSKGSKQVFSGNLEISLIAYY
ncbi:hypothetical protein COU58_00300 [Candidatus Pacearchaeota archaeon CG10_big_fil_rev_8_21_14_0_10_32_42]|nr:MAG: hypothetical protein COU58_00300 [Candidatus Pacearchaeota archaeon CG10_big_fil_rev_8_21_14_0_10_32_42]